MELTPLETAILNRLHKRYEDYNFPAAKNVHVLSRTNTGAGRFTSLICNTQVNLPDGLYGNGDYSYIQMDCQGDYLQFTVLLESHKVIQIELSTIGNDDWDGVERNWRFAEELNLQIK